MMGSIGVPEMMGVRVVVVTTLLPVPAVVWAVGWIIRLLSRLSRTQDQILQRLQEIERRFGAKPE
jgi:hypothetical protein